jgi:hypothetical protein
MRYYFRALVRSALFILGLMVFGQETFAQKQSYTKGYYQFPIRPGLANSLAGGLGDLRSNHFHAGLDIRTEQREGLPVYAAAEGYVYRVAVQRSGYGNVIYLRHPNGQTTVYGHLLKFSDPLASYVREEQYKKQSFDRKVYTPVKQKDGSYRLATPVSATGIIGLDLVAHDQMTGTGFRYGLQCIEIKMDGREVFSYNIEIFPNASTRDYNNLIDYETEQETGQRFLKCYVPDGNNFNLYKTDAYKGKLNITDTLSHEVSIRISDSFENISELLFTIKGEQQNTPLPVYDVEVNPESVQTDVQENTLVVKAKYYRSSIPFATYYSQGKEIKKTPDFYANESAVFVTDLREYRPDSVRIGNTIVKTYLRSQVFAGVVSTYKGEKWSVDFKNTSLFDTLFLTGERNFNALYINNRGTALNDYISVAFAPENVPENKERTKVYRYLNGDYRFVGGKWEDDYIRFDTRELGTFVIQADTVPPRARLVEHSKSRIRGFVGDGLSGIDQFKALVNGQWVLLNYDFKKGYIWSEKLDENQLFEGELVLEVTDRAGNSTILRTEIAEPVVIPKKSRKRKR